MVGRDTPEPIRLGRPCKTSHVKAVIVNQEYPCFSCGECQGYKLFCDFPEILEKSKNKFKKLNETREIAELKEKLRKLEEDNEGNGEWK